MGGGISKTQCTDRQRAPSPKRRKASKQIKAKNTINASPKIISAWRDFYALYIPLDVFSSLSPAGSRKYNSHCVCPQALHGQEDMKEPPYRCQHSTGKQFMWKPYVFYWKLFAIRLLFQPWLPPVFSVLARWFQFTSQSPPKYFTWVICGHSSCWCSLFISLVWYPGPRLLLLLCLQVSTELVKSL